MATTLVQTLVVREGKARCKMSRLAVGFGGAFSRFVLCRRCRDGLTVQVLLGRWKPGSGAFAGRITALLGAAKQEGGAFASRKLHKGNLMVRNFYTSA